MNTYMCEQCQSIWSDLNIYSTCPNCSEKTIETPISSERSIRFRLFESKGNWSLECKRDFEQTKQFTKVYWSEEPTEQLLHEALNEQLKCWLEK
jgi:DNA-directed RNA polymerase subunit RPC12/RpoP